MRKRIIPYAVVGLLLVAVCAYTWLMVPQQVVAQRFDDVRAITLHDAPQGYSKYYQQSLDATWYGANGATPQTARLTQKHVSDAGYWFHSIGIEQVASTDTGGYGGWTQWHILPYIGTADSTSIAATYITVTFATPPTAQVVMLPVNCYQFTTRLATPNTAQLSPGFDSPGATYTTSKAFKAIGWQKTHN